MIQDILCAGGAHRWHEEYIKIDGSDNKGVHRIRCIRCDMIKVKKVVTIIEMPSKNVPSSKVAIRFNVGNKN
jgi:hypothetical protein